MSEVEAKGISFNIDHYVPQVAGGTDVYDNLMWTCHPCNSAKNSIWPDSAKVAQGYRYLRPDQDAFEEHIELSGRRVKPLSTPAEFTIEVLYLNSALHQKLRELRLRIFNSRAAVLDGMRALQGRRADFLKPQHRARFLDAKKNVQEQQRLISDEVADALAARSFNASALLNAAAGDLLRTKLRREYLEGIGVAMIRR